MVKPLRFPPAPPAPVQQDRPRPIVFAPVPSPAPAPSIEHDVRAISGHERVPLQFNAPTPMPAPVAKTPPKKIVFPPSVSQARSEIKSGARNEVLAAFEQTLSPLAKAAVTELKHSHAELYAKQGAHLERQINQLLPLDVPKIMAWAGNTLGLLTSTSAESVKLLQEFMGTNGNKLIEDTLTVIQGKQSFFAKITSRGDGIMKPQLAALQSQLTHLLPRVEALLVEANKAADKLVNKMTSLRVICDVSGKIQDDALADAVQDRQILLGQSATQAQIVIQQLTETRKLIVDQLSRVQQLLHATIPAYESAKVAR